MTPWIQSSIPKEEIELFRRIQKAVWALPDLELGEYMDGEKILLSCHILARAVGKVFGLPVQDGYYYPNCRHSWLLLPSRTIVDTYPVGTVGGPILVDNTLGWSPGHWLYKSADPFEVSKHPTFHFGQPCFLKAVQTTTRALAQCV